MKQFIKIFLTFLIIFTMILGTGLYFILAKEDKISENIGENEVVDKPVDDDEDGDRINVLLAGVDSLDVGEKGTRTDTMMVLSLDPKMGTASILSIPRDSRVKIRGRNGYDKINAAHAYGGIDLTLKTVKDLLGIPIHHYVKVDYNALFKTVDDVGGIEFDVPMNMKYDDPYATPPLHINLKKGVQVLDGKKAMQLLRFRKNNKGGGYPRADLQRIEVQQQFMDALIKKVLSPSSILKIPKYIQTFYMYVDTDLSEIEMVNLALKASKINSEDIRKETIPGEDLYINAVSYFKPDLEGIKDLVAELYYDKKSDDKTTTTITSKKDLKIAVLNGNGRSGIATTVSDKLTKANLKPAIVENADDFSYKETIIYYSDDKETAEEIKDILGVGVLKKDETALKEKNVDIIVIIGKDI